MTNIPPFFIALALVATFVGGAFVALYGIQSVLPF